MESPIHSDQSQNEDIGANMPNKPFINIAKKLLEGIKTPEEAIALKGLDRENYLKALDTIYGTKEQRMAEMGLTKPVYHGTNVAPFTEFEPSSAGYYGPGVYTSDFPSVAKQYGQRVLPLRTSENLLDVRGYNLNKDIPAEVLEKANQAQTEAARNQILAKEGGYAGLTAPYKGENVITDLTKVRHEDAAFDPRFKSSKNILASLAGTAGLAAALSPNESSAAQETIAPEMTVLDKAKDLGLTGLNKTLNMLSTPSAMLKEATYAAQKGTPVLEALKRGWQAPEQAPTGEQIAEATGLSDEYPNLKASIATAADFADPLDWAGLGAIDKLKQFKNIRKLLK